MKFTSRLRDRITYASLEWRESSALRGVQFAIRRISLLGRLELVERVQELYKNHEFLRAGDTLDQLDAARAELLVKQLYLEWGLIAARGLKIDGQEATASLLVQSGPEVLSDEIVEAIKSELGLTEEQRKNF